MEGSFQPVEPREAIHMQLTGIPLSSYRAEALRPHSALLKMHANFLTVSARITHFYLAHNAAGDPHLAHFSVLVLLYSVPQVLVTSVNFAWTMAAALFCLIIFPSLRPLSHLSLHINTSFQLAIAAPWVNLIDHDTATVQSYHFNAICFISFHFS